MFLGTIEVNEYEYEYSDYESFHNIICDFKDKYDLTIINIGVKNDKLEYQFTRNDIEEDEVIYGMNHVTVSFSRRINFIIATLETTTGTFDKFAYMYQDLERISKKYFK